MGELRVKHRVPEVIVVAAAYTTNDGVIAMMSGYGDPRTHPTLAASAYKQYTAPVIERAKQLQALALGGNMETG